MRRLPRDDSSRTGEVFVRIKNNGSFHIDRLTYVIELGAEVW
jgi:hypothetical protein